MNLQIATRLLGSKRAEAVTLGGRHRLCIITGRHPLENCAYNAYYKNSHGRERGKLPMKSRSRASTPTTVKRTVARGRLPNAKYRTREYLTEREVERLMKAAVNNRHGHREATMIHAFGGKADPPHSSRWLSISLSVRPKTF